MLGKKTNKKKKIIIQLETSKYLRSRCEAHYDTKWNKWVTTKAGDFFCFNIFRTHCRATCARIRLWGFHFVVLAVKRWHFVCVKFVWFRRIFNLKSRCLFEWHGIIQLWSWLLCMAYSIYPIRIWEIHASRSNVDNSIQSLENEGKRKLNQCTSI